MSPRPTRTSLPPKLLRHMHEIREGAIEHGLDFFEVIFEVLDFRTMNQIAAFGGFPVRYPHWRWGMEYDKLDRRDAYGMGRIYEMVINNDPCYAYLQESNATLDQKLVMAHVFAHSDFFKRNAWFARTNRKMMDEMANHATRVRRHIERHGADTVERFIDTCVSVENLIDPHSLFVRRDRREKTRRSEFEPRRFRAKPGMDRYINPPEAIERQRVAHQQEQERRKRLFPESPTRDVLRFLLEHAPLEPWQHDILSLIRDESYYYAPQGMTKVMNEGWATYWHSKLMTSRFLEAAELIDYADQHAGVVHMPPGGFNPYKLGVELFKDIERRWDTGQHGPVWERLDDIGARGLFDDESKGGREKIFEVRAIYNDVSFIDEFMTPEFIDRHRMYHYRRDERTGELKVVTRDPEQVKQILLYRLANAGQPHIHVVDANYMNRGELFLAHEWNGLDLEIKSAVETITSLRRLWGRPVRLQARIDEEMWLFTCQDADAQPSRERIGEDTPGPAHAIA
ncbi:MAG: SpoVR family protein [Phycisphaeraceae bacterium]|nr:SpoVR family protein [Phycisphaeraceae bacterium]MCB9846964.1 SpoVR family protein [Phycisphaeraceae bacterium]